MRILEKLLGYFYMSNEQVAVASQAVQIRKIKGIAWFSMPFSSDIMSIALDTVSVDTVKFLVPPVTSGTNSNLRYHQ